MNHGRPGRVVYGVLRNVGTAPAFSTTLQRRVLTGLVFKLLPTKHPKAISGQEYSRRGRASTQGAAVLPFLEGSGDPTTVRPSATKCPIPRGPRTVVQERRVRGDPASVRKPTASAHFAAGRPRSAHSQPPPGLLPGSRGSSHQTSIPTQR